MSQGSSKKIKSIAQSFGNLITQIGEDVTREGLIKTPERAAIAFEFLTQGYQEDLNTLVNDAIFKSSSDEIVIVKNIELYSLCEHHLLPFIGKCHIGYIPNGKILGLSKFARIVDMFSRRLQTQEYLTEQICDALQQVTGATGTAVVIEAEHLCMRMRGVEKQNTVMKTSVMKGSLREDPRTRNEFLQLLHD